MFASAAFIVGTVLLLAVGGLADRVVRGLPLAALAGMAMVWLWVTLHEESPGALTANDLAVFARELMVVVSGLVTGAIRHVLG